MEDSELHSQISYIFLLEINLDKNCLFKSVAHVTLNPLVPLVGDPIASGGRIWGTYITVRKLLNRVFLAKFVKIHLSCTCCAESVHTRIWGFKCGWWKLWRGNDAITSEQRIFSENCDDKSCFHVKMNPLIPTFGIKMCVAAENYTHTHTHTHTHTYKHTHAHTHTTTDQVL